MMSLWLGKGGGWMDGGWVCTRVVFAEFSEHGSIVEADCLLASIELN